MIISIILIFIMLIFIYSCCVIAGQIDEELERNRKKWKRK